MLWHEAVDDGEGHDGRRRGVRRAGNGGGEHGRRRRGARRAEEGSTGGEGVRAARARGAWIRRRGVNEERDGGFSPF
jgi:hypothetical protein